MKTTDYMIRLIRCALLVLGLVVLTPCLWAIDHKGIVSFEKGAEGFPLVLQGEPTAILTDEGDKSGVRIAAENLAKDFLRVCSQKPSLLNAPEGGRIIIAGTLESRYIKQLAKNGLIDVKPLKGKTEKYCISFVSRPLKGVGEALVIAGSDMRGAIYGIYEISEQLGVSPWYDWADVPVRKHDFVTLKRGSYTAGEPAVRYRGIFLNDEAPCLTSWVKNTYGTGYGDHRFYERVGELLLRLRANFLWPAMWSWTFYGDDPENSKTMSQMGIIMGTSHHEPMARNHQEWARNRAKLGVWNYETNQKTIDDFFRFGMERAKNNEDLITIGMRGDGDASMSGKDGADVDAEVQDKKDMLLLEKIIRNQRKMIAQVTGKPAEMRPQVWALYKEVQRYWDKGLRVPDDVTLLFCDDNWGNVRRLPTEKERQRKGGFGMYYHVDYVGAPRNSKLLNVTPVQNLFEQMSLTYDYGVRKLWILNVGDLKPMEYPITLFLNMAWNAKQYSSDDLLLHTEQFCREAFGEGEAKEAARILNLLCKYNGRVTPEMLSKDTYSLATGEYEAVLNQYTKLEAEALRQYLTLPVETRDCYEELILFPLQLMSNLYEMYFSQAMNWKLYDEGKPQANDYADRVEQCFKRDSLLMRHYNEDIANGKWRGMMTQKHIGYKIWNDNFPKDICPQVKRLKADEKREGGYTYYPDCTFAAMEAEHWFSKTDAKNAKWQTLPFVGRTLSGVTLAPATESVEGASLSYRLRLPEGAPKEVKVHVVVKSTLSFMNSTGHRYTVGFSTDEAKEVNFNANLNEDPQNVYSVFYPTVVGRVVEKVVSLPVGKTDGEGCVMLTLIPKDPAIVFEKIVVDFGGYKKQYLFGKESECKR